MVGELALSRVDELERRVAKAEREIQTDSSYELYNDSLMEEVYNVRSYDLTFNQLVTSTQSRLVFLLNVELASALPLNLTVSLYCGKECIYSVPNHSTTSINIMRSVSVEPNQRVSLRLHLESATTLDLVIMRYSLVVLGSIKRSFLPISTLHVSADLFEPDIEPEPEPEPQPEPVPAPPGSLVASSSILVS